MVPSGERLDAIREYELVVFDEIESESFNRSSPIAVTAEKVGKNRCRLIAKTDQSGLIGLVRHLHHTGIVLLSIARKRQVLGEGR